MTKDGLIALMRARIKKTGTAREFAESIHVGPAYISDILAGKREPGKRVLEALGLERAVYYRPVPKQEASL